MFLFSVYFLILFSCQKSPSEQEVIPTFEQTPQQYPLSSATLTEASGLADSKKNTGYLWVHEDGGNPPQIFLLKKNGVVSKSIYIKGATNRDWEDMALAKGPDASLDYIYLGDIGDNTKQYSTYHIYRFAEPSSSTDTVKTFDKISFKYTDGAHDAEAMLVDNNTKEIYIITKDNPARIYKIPYPQSITATNNAVLADSLTYGNVVSASISTSGKNIILKTYFALSLYPRKTGETIEQAFKKTPTPLPYQMEPQGEAVAYANDNSGYFTLSEKGMGSSVSLFFYKRK